INMRKFTIVMLMLFAGQMLLAQNNVDPRAKLQGLKWDTNPSGTRQVAATITPTNFYVAGMTMDLNFTLIQTNIDAEYGDSLSITFPAGITPNSSPTDPIYIATEGQPNEALNGVFGQSVTWGDNDNNYGGIEPGNLIPFTINVTIDPTVMGTQTINFFISGDEFGAAPGDLSGSFTIDELPAAPVGSLTPTTPFGALAEIGTPVSSGPYGLTNTGGDTLTISGTSYAQATGAFTDNFAAMAVVPGDTAFFNLTYAPTAVANDVDTFVISTNDGDFSIPLLGYSYGNGTTLEGFENVLFPACQWTTVDQDGDGFDWTPGFVGNGQSANTGSFSATSASYDNPSATALTPDNYMISPQLTPDANNSLFSWFVAAQDPNFAAEFYEVYVSTAGNTPGDFTTSLFSETLATNAWQERSLDLSAYVGQNIYIAFRHYNVSDQFVMKIDDIRMPPQTVPNNTLPPLDLTLIGTGIVCPGQASGIIQASVTGGGNLYAYLFPGIDTTVTDMTNFGVGGNLGEGEYLVNVLDNCGNDVLDSVVLAATSTLDDASFVFPWDTLCKLDSMNIGPSITGLAGGTFSGTTGLVFEDAATGKIDVLASPVGTYEVVYTTNGTCPNSDTTTIVINETCTTTAIETLAEAGISLYPNPNQGQFVLRNSGTSREATVEVMTAQGQIVYRAQNFLGANQNLEINLGDVAAGMYLIKVSSDASVAVDRLIVR
ncbi:MAG: choice-of-anchor J domain-containing protein, partial [Bacteroidota bacterium]